MSVALPSVTSDRFTLVARLLDPPASRRLPSLLLIGLAQVAALSLWFSATAVVPALRQDAALSPLLASLFTSAVQIGFVAGTLVSALFGLADRVDPRRPMP